MEGALKKGDRVNFETLIEAQEIAKLESENKDLISALEEKIRVRDLEIENLKRDFDAQLNSKDNLIDYLRKLRYPNEEKVLTKEESAMAYLLIKGKSEGHFVKSLKNNHECKDEKREILVRENERLFFEARERESVLKERENSIEELKLCLEREKAEKEKLICILKEREGVYAEVKQYKEREEVLERENEKLGSLVRERESQILHLNCEIGSVFCADGEIKAILENIVQKLNFEDEIIKPNPPKN